jgi:hypothetical protein
MRMRGLVFVILVGCTESRAPVVTSTVEARPDAASAPDATASASASPTSSGSTSISGTSCADAVADAQKKDNRGWKDDTTHDLDVDGDGTPECVLRSCYGGNCDLVLYHRGRGALRRIGEMKSSIVSSPYCMDTPPKGTFCRLDVGVFMIHGETMPTYWKYVGDHYVEDGHGELLPGPSHHKPPHP